MTAPLNHLDHLDDALAQRYVDGALDRDEAGCCAEHVQCCDDCRLVVESYRALGDALEGLGAPEPDPDFTCCVLSRIDEAERANARERRVAGAVLAAAAAVLAAVFAWVGASAFAPGIASAAAAAGDALRLAVVGVDVASPLLRALRLQIVLGCVLFGLPLLLALRRLAVREAAPVAAS